MSFTARGGRVRVCDRKALAPGVYPYKVNVRTWPSVAIQWRLPTISGLTDATIAVYSSTDEWSDELLLPLAATNPAWTLEPAAVFASNPGETALSSAITLQDNPYMTLMVIVTVANPVTEFSLAVSGH